MWEILLMIMPTIIKIFGPLLGLSSDRQKKFIEFIEHNANRAAGSVELKDNYSAQIEDVKNARDTAKQTKEGDTSLH
jgi:hypothetical protein